MFPSHTCTLNFFLLHLRSVYIVLLEFALMCHISCQLRLRWGYYNHALRQVANLFNKVIICVQRHAFMFVQVYPNPFIGERILNIYTWEVRRNIDFTTMVKVSCGNNFNINKLNVSTLVQIRCVRGWFTPWKRAFTR